tara:strand:- start:63 stop:299 length:237 start_codon:yes stop_codon:yes gene_type:complete
MIRTLLYAYTQVMLVVINTWQVANQKFVGAIIVGFLISLVWTFNIKRVAFGDWTTRLIYCAGASLGTASGLIITHFIY